LISSAANVNPLLNLPQQRFPDEGAALSFISGVKPLNEVIVSACFSLKLKGLAVVQLPYNIISGKKRVDPAYEKS
jgi:hypothetical protein